MERLCVPLCDAVIQLENSHEVLNTLEKTNLLVIPQDDQRYWYRYHQLFADLLQQRLRISQADLVPGLHHRTSQWLAKNGFTNEAVEHAFAAQDYSQAAQLIQEIAEVDWDLASVSFMPAIQIQTLDKEKRDTVVLQGGFDSLS